MQKHAIRNGLLLLVLFILISIVSAQYGVRAVVVAEYINIRISPALGADVLGQAPAGFEFKIITARSPDNEWLRVDWLGNEAWVHVAPLAILEGDINVLPVADPRSIPYGGWDGPRAGLTNETGPITARTLDNVHMRAGPARSYPSLVHLWAKTEFQLTGRTAANTWFQGVFDGVLGWVSAQYLEILGSDANAVPDVNSLPVDGIIAHTPPLSDTGHDDYIAQLKFIRDRLNLAQIPLDEMRARWTDASINGFARCGNYPARPSDLHIARPLLAAHYPVLNYLQLDFNSAMGKIRNAIDELYNICDLPGSGVPVGQGATQGVLGVIAAADIQFADLRRRLDDLIPPDIVVGDGQCLITFNGRSEALPIVQPGIIYLEEYTARDYIKGYCIDLAQGQVLNLQTLPLPDSNVSTFVSLSITSNVTNFIAVGKSGSGQQLSLGPITINEPGRYLMIIADIGDPGRDAPPQGKLAFLLQDIASATVINSLAYDAATGSIIFVQTGGITTGGTTGPITGLTPTPGVGQVVCPSLAFTCSQLFSCAEAQASYNAGNKALDTNNNGIPCSPDLCQ
ncbi:hypothetical protein MASR2M15_15880 [Anaerolineales bacterium]